MTTVAAIAAILAGLLHVMIFAFESVLWSRPKTWRRFGVHSQADADVLRPMALNQGFYNLFLGIGALVGAGVLLAGDLTVGRTLILFSCGCMLAAAVVLVVSNPKLARAAVTQGALPLLAVVLTLFV